MTTKLQTLSFSHISEEIRGFDGFVAASAFRTDKRMPEAGRRQRRVTRRRRLHS